MWNCVKPVNSKAKNTQEVSRLAAKVALGRGHDINCQLKRME